MGGLGQKGIMTAVEERDPRWQKPERYRQWEKERDRGAHRRTHKENISPKPFAGEKRGADIRDPRGFNPEKSWAWPA